jgi:hypothetical protein
VSFVMRNRSEYGETLPQKTARHHANAEEPLPGSVRDLPTDRADEYAPAPWWWVDPSFKTCAIPMPVLAGSCSTGAAPIIPHRTGAAVPCAAGGPGRSCPPAAHPTREAT